MFRLGGVVYQIVSLWLKPGLVVTGKVAAAVGDLRSREERWKRNAESCVLMQAVMGREVGAPTCTGI